MRREQINSLKESKKRFALFVTHGSIIEQNIKLQWHATPFFTFGNPGEYEKYLLT